MKNKNTHTTREGWLLAATDELRPHFADHGFTLPDKIRHALAFTSTASVGVWPENAGMPIYPATSILKFISGRIKMIPSKCLVFLSMN